MMAWIGAMPVGPLTIERIKGTARSRFSFSGKTYVTSSHGYRWPHPSGDGVFIELVGAEEGYRPDPGILAEAVSDEWARFYKSPWRRFVFRLPTSGPGEYPTHWDHVWCIEFEVLKDG